MILAFNTSLADLHIGIFSDDAEMLAEFHHHTSPDERGVHDKLLAKKTSDLLEELSASAKDISLITFINGPGSFTGLRIGLAFAKGMAFGSEHISLAPLIAHSVLLEEYKKENPVDRNIPILYPGYAKDSLYVSYSDEPEKVVFMQLADLLKSGISHSICSPELSGIQIPHRVVPLSIQTMAAMAAKSTSRISGISLGDLEPFYGTDFKPTLAA